MKSQILLLSILFLLVSVVSYAQEEARLSVTAGPSGEIAIAIQPRFHAQYGCAYPLTYMFDIGAAAHALKASYRRHAGEPSTPLPVRGGSDLFNAVDAARFDYAARTGYLSASFAGGSDSLFLTVYDSLDSPVPVRYLGISRYYDNRRAAVTVTADDWSDWTAAWYNALLGIFRRHGLYVTAGIITGGGNTTRSTWLAIQNQLNLGCVEAAAHSRTHTHTPYALPDSEVLGCERDVEMLALPPLFSVNNTGYVYVWLAPYGDFDSSTDSLLGVGHYLVARLYTYAQSPLSSWEADVSHFAPLTPTLEIGAPSWGGGDTSIASLNGTFDAVAAAGGLYHFMWHPQVIITDTAMPYFVNHLNYISNRPDIWYANLGHIYLYHMIQEMNSTGVTSVASRPSHPGAFRLEQNYPNPFNPSTRIRYSLPDRASVRLTVFNSIGQEVVTLVNTVEGPGIHEASLDGSGLASGVYFYRLAAGSRVAVKKLVILR
ncbi:MAG TPA: T9SS type A sorting domain-containing protein [Bacteroidota bacterium]|nr:T9SS type A sorting domain-containing protein [Bacteroidota bacterium]